nr:YwmB family TATA-box binding protein [uncultured Bacillus sp.]
MKKILLVLLSLFTISFIYFNFVSAKEEPGTDLQKMADVLQRENIFIHEWTLYVRQKMEGSGEKQQNMLREQFPELSWNISQGEDQWETSAFFSKKRDVQESIRLLSSGSEAYLIYEVKGKGWSDETEEFLQESVQQTISEVFQEDVTIFSCLTGEFGDKLDKSLDLYASNLLAAFDAQEIERLEEGSFVSATAYSPLFRESIKGQFEDMNVQVGLREEGLGGKTTLVVGTPIITIEY